MGFFKDFKDDFSQAVNELMPGEDNLEDGAANEDLVVNTCPLYISPSLRD